MSLKPFLTILAATAMLGVPAVAVAAAPADRGPASHPGKPLDAGRPADAGKPSAPGTTADAPDPADAGSPSAPQAQGDDGAEDDAVSDYTDPLGPTVPAHTKAKAYGKYCSKLSHRHGAGHKGTPFSQCVTAMAKLAHGTVASPVRACKALSRRHVAGQKGTPFSRCVVAAAKLRRDTHAESTDQDAGVLVTPRG